MTHSPLDNPHRCRARATWLAFAALLGNVLLPAVLSIFVLNEPGRDTPICGQWSGDASGKVMPALLVLHCPLCTVPAAALPRPPRIAVPGKLADEGQLQRLASLSVALIRHGRVQARAPPSIA